MANIIVPKRKAVTVRQEGDRVLVIKDGRAVFNMPYQAALELARAIHIKAKEAEEVANAEQIALDQAVLLRAGAPFGLTNNPRIQKEAAKEAAWNSQLRRQMPGGVKSEETVGTPAVIQHEPDEPEGDEDENE